MALWGNDDFKFPQRKDLMVLDTIKPEHPPGASRYQTTVPSSLRPAEQCVPGYITNRKFNRPDLHSPDDITRSPKRPLSGRRPVDLSLKTDDIAEGEMRHMKFRTNRVVNPLDPQYNIPAYEEQPPVELPFVRDTLDVSDINQPQRPKEKRLVPKPSLEGTHPDALRLRTKFPANIRGDRREYNYMDTHDINKDYRLKPSPAGRNPVDPHYVLPNWNASALKWPGAQQTPLASQEDLHLGPPPGSNPRQHARDLKKPELCFDTSAIEGASPKPLVPKEPRRGTENLHGTLDIPGAQADTHPRGLKSNRQVNPLDPSYKWESGGLPYPQGPENLVVRRGRGVGSLRAIQCRSFDLLSNEPTPNSG